MDTESPDPGLSKSMRRLLYVILFMPVTTGALFYALSFVPIDWCEIIPGLPLWRAFVYSYWPATKTFYTGMALDISMESACLYLAYTFIAVLNVFLIILFSAILSFSIPHEKLPPLIPKINLKNFLMQLFLFVMIILITYDTIFDNRYNGIYVNTYKQNRCYRCIVPSPFMNGIKIYFLITMWSYLTSLITSIHLGALIITLRHHFGRIGRQADATGKGQAGIAKHSLPSTPDDRKKDGTTVR